MKKIYEEPELEIRNYVLPPKNVVLTSEPDLHDGPDFNYFN